MTLADTRAQALGLLEDLNLQRLQPRPGLESQLFGQRRARALVDLECVALTTNPVESEHQLAGQALTGWLLGHQGLKLTNHLRLPPQSELGFDPAFQRAQPELVQATNLGLREVLESDLGQRWTSPQR